MRNIPLIILMLINLSAIRAQHDDLSTLTRVKDVKHTIVYHQPGRFAGWPANNGSWQFSSNEILVGFTEAEYRLQSGHNAEGPYRSWLTRSKDGGNSWNVYDPVNYAGDFGEQPEIMKLKEPLKFTHPNFAMRVVGTGYHGNDDPKAHFFVTADKGISWKGPYTFGHLNIHPELQKYNLTELTPRTDYIVTGPNECLVFMSAREPGVFGSDRLFCIKTSDGGMTFRFHGWIVPPYDVNEIKKRGRINLYGNYTKNPFDTECRAVMSSSVQIDGDNMIVVIRRKYENSGDIFNWIDAYRSSDGGTTWKYLSHVANTGHGNGNPPAIALLSDGRLCVVYGERTNGTIQAVLSQDGGKSWRVPQILMDGFWSEDMELDDLGYPRLVNLKDEKLMAIYYYSTKEHLHHLRASVWRP